MTMRRTVVRNHGNMNKGGSKTVLSYGTDGSLKSTKTIRGSLGNKNGGLDNQYSINTTYTSSGARNNYSTKTATNHTAGSADAGLTLIIFLILPIIAAVSVFFAFTEFIADLIISGFSLVLNLIF